MKCFDPDPARRTNGRGAAAAGVAHRLEEDVPGGRGRMASGGEAGAGGGVVEETMVPSSDR